MTKLKLTKASNEDNLQWRMEEDLKIGIPQKALIGSSLEVQTSNGR